MTFFNIIKLFVLLVESNDSKKLAVSDEFVEEPEPETTLFVKNLNFETTEEAFKLVIISCWVQLYL